MKQVYFVFFELNIFAKRDIIELLGKEANVSKPKCSTCQSENIQKISTMTKAGSVALWGIFSQKIKKQWHYNSCWSEW